MSELEVLKQELDNLLQFIETAPDSDYLLVVHREQIGVLEMEISRLENGN
tara:strand:+ start:1009 stop:1158 length:150 start_codon:yes stop_codon:yes gene_type:complete